MRAVFVDMSYWVARSNRRDQWHLKARESSSQLDKVLFLTTELVLVEYLNFFSEFGDVMREQTAVAVERILADSKHQIVWQSQALFESGLALYKSRLDKGYSLTDCVSIVVMREAGIQDALTHDRHFAQEGFTILL
jgi:uncharacterized protein